MRVACTMRRQFAVNMRARYPPSEIMPPVPPVPPEPPEPPEPRVLVRRAFDREVTASGELDDEEAADRVRLEAAARLAGRVLVGMPSWFGNAGTYALASRALARVQAEQHLLTSMTLVSGDAGLRGLDTAAVTDGAAATVEGILEFLEAFAVGLGRLVGAYLTARLFTECALPADRSATVPTAPLSQPRHTSND